MLHIYMFSQFFCDKDVEEYLASHPEAIQCWIDGGHFYDRFVKRFLDFVLALILCILLLPFLAVIALAVKFSSPGPILYRGIRGAYGGGSFRIFKFRSMVVNADQFGGGTTALNDSRITRIGFFLRKTKIDEIPQLFNILLGDMSFVGPRPELLQYIKMYRGAEEVILQVRPGITDVSSLTFISLAEVVGGTNADETYERLVLKKKNYLRIGYVLFQSPWLDIKLICITVWQVIIKFFNSIFRR